MDTTVETAIGRTDASRPCADRIATAIACASLLLFCAAATAQQESGSDPVPEELELTMTLMPEGAELPDAVTKTIQLPAAAAGSGAADAAERGIATANDARANRLEGLDTAAEARERGLEFGEEMAEQARENREDAGRGDPPVDPPNGPPDDLPGPPGDLGDRPGDVGGAPGGIWSPPDDPGGMPAGLDGPPSDTGGPPGDTGIPEPPDTPRN